VPDVALVRSEVAREEETVRGRKNRDAAGSAVRCNRAIADAFGMLIRTIGQNILKYAGSVVKRNTRLHVAACPLIGVDGHSQSG